MPGPTVIVIEPDAMQRDLMVMALRRSDFSPEVCTQIEDLPALLKEKSPPVLLLDIYLPGQNGLDLVSELKNRGLLQNTRVIGIASMAFSEVVRKMVQTGFVDVLVKPVDTELLIERVRRAAV